MRIFVIIFLTFVFAVSALSQTRLKVGATAPLFTATALDGTGYNLNELRGSVVVLTFWSTKCAICRSELPKLNRLVKSFEGKNVVFLALTMENDGWVAAYVKNNPLEAHVLPNSLGTVLQYADRDRSGNLDMGFPSFFVINTSGKIEFRSSGYDKTESLNAAISRLITNK